MSDKIDLIYDLVKSDREESSEFRKEVRESTKDTHSRLMLIESGLAEHMRRTDLLEDLHKDNEVRIVKLEEPKMVWSTLKRWTITVGAVIGAVVAILELIKIIG